MHIWDQFGVDRLSSCPSYLAGLFPKWPAVPLDLAPPYRTLGPPLTISVEFIISAIFEHTPTKLCLALKMQYEFFLSLFAVNTQRVTDAFAGVIKRK